MITVIGEALIDLVPGRAPGAFVARPGGSPYNVAIGLARLGVDTSLMARLAGNTFGATLRRHAATEGVRLDAAPLASEPTTLAVVQLDADGQAGYDFYRDGTADWQWTAAELAQLPAGTRVLHFGSLASWTPPGSELLHELAVGLRARGDVLLSYDPNVRPALMGSPSDARVLVERSVAVAHLVKASRDDISWLYPEGGEAEGDADSDVAAQVAQRWLDLGATAVVITDGDRGATAFTGKGTRVHLPSRPIRLVDTVGAGDAFTAGLLASLVRQGCDTPQRLATRGGDDADDGDDALVAAVEVGIRVAALTCERVGADPPTAAEAGLNI